MRANGTDSLRILLDATHFQDPLTGIARATAELYTACLALEPSISIQALHRRPLQCELPAAVGTIQFAEHLPALLWRRVALPYHCFRARPDVIHFPANRRVVRACRDSVIVLTVHDIIRYVLSNLYFKTSLEKDVFWLRTQYCLKNSDLIVTVSEHSKKDILSNFSVRSEVVVSYPASRLVNLSLKSSYPHKDRSHFLYVGGDNPRKGLDITVACHSYLFRSRQIGSPLVLVGAFRADYVQSAPKIVRDAVAEGSTVFRGHVPDRELVALYQNAHALVFHSQYEGFGLPALEAMHLGCPVITTNVSSLPEVCGDAALYVSPDQPHQLAAAMLMVSKDQAFRRLLIERGYRQARKFSAEKSARLYLDALQRKVAEKRGRHLSS